METVARGTTPTFRIYLDYDLTGWDIYVTFRQSCKRAWTFKNHYVEKTALGCDLILDLTQEDTLKFIPGRLWVEIRATNEDDAVRSTKMKFWVEDVLLDGEIPQEV